MPHTLLLADDSVTIQRVIELTFADEAINVVAVSDGDQAIERIEAEPPDIVLVDIGMPGRTGYEVAQHIKQSARLKHIPVLLLTGAFEPVDQAKALAAGSDGVLAKPFEPQLVIARVKELLARGEQDAAAPEAPVAASEVPAPAAASSEDSLLPGEGWGLPHPGPTTEKPHSAQVASLDNYFEQLDAAFQSLGDSAPVEHASVPAPVSPVADIIDWFGGPAAPSGPRDDLPLSGHASQSDRGHVLNAGTPEPLKFTSKAAPQMAPSAPVAERPLSSPESPAPSTPSTPSPLPSIADAFAAILAAEQHEPLPALAVAWPTQAPTPTTADGALSEDAIEEITRRVLDRLSDRVVRETAADLISSIAERLVREEIERIKAAIK